VPVDPGPHPLADVPGGVVPDQFSSHTSAARARVHGVVGLPSSRGRRWSTSWRSSSRLRSHTRPGFLRAWDSTTRLPSPCALHPCAHFAYQRFDQAAGRRQPVPAVPRVRHAVPSVPQLGPRRGRHPARSPALLRRRRLTRRGLTQTRRPRPQLGEHVPNPARPTRTHPDLVLGPTGRLIGARRRGRRGHVAHRVQDVGDRLDAPEVPPMMGPWYALPSATSARRRAA
jgi:hypothetical protein